jgi:hypothetical protein
MVRFPQGGRLNLRFGFNIRKIWEDLDVGKILYVNRNIQIFCVEFLNWDHWWLGKFEQMILVIWLLGLKRYEKSHIIFKHGVMLNVQFQWWILVTFYNKISYFFNQHLMGLFIENFNNFFGLRNNHSIQGVFEIINLRINLLCMVYGRFLTLEMVMCLIFIYDSQFFIKALNNFRQILGRFSFFLNLILSKIKHGALNLFRRLYLSRSHTFWGSYGFFHYGTPWVPLGESSRQSRLVIEVTIDVPNVDLWVLPDRGSLLTLLLDGFRPHSPVRLRQLWRV